MPFRVSTLLRATLLTCAALVVACSCDPESPTDAAPAQPAIAYTGSPAVLTKGVATTLVPTSTGGPVDGYAVSPALPVGLALDAKTGAIAGTPTALALQTAYTVTATNAAGSATATVLLAVQDAAPAGLDYADSPAVLTKGVAVTLVPSSTGGDIAGYDVSPALPAGLALDTQTGVVAGTPTAVAPEATYTITAINETGSTTAILIFTVNDAAPAGLAYVDSPAVLTKGVVATLVPSSNGGEIVAYAVSPALPAGLALDEQTGVIAGTPTAVVPEATYRVTASNGTGTASADVILTVKDVAPAGLAYEAMVLTKGVEVPPTAPISNTGGAILAYSVEPALPAGLVLDPVTGVVAGTPTVLAPEATYTVTGRNGTGETTASLTLTVNDAKPTSLGYGTSTLVLTKGVAATTLTPTVGGGTVVSYTVEPPLPAGLALEPTLGILSGTPTALAPEASYVITAANTGGSAAVTLSITVNDQKPANLTYSTTAAMYPPGVAITPLLPTASGGAVVSYSVEPALPAGLTLDPQTGVISGTPTTPGDAATYVVTATNSGGQATVTLTFGVGAPLAITTQPATVAKNVGASATFSVVATGGGTLTYQWKRDGVAIPGARSESYTIAATVAADDGARFEVDVGNGISTLASSSATLSVLGGVISAGPSMGTSRAYHTATLLPNGKVLVAGGREEIFFLDSAELYDPATNTFGGVNGTLTTKKTEAQAAVLANGMVLLAGGHGVTLNQGSADLYDPVTNRLSTTGSLNAGRGAFALVALANGKALALGGGSPSASTDTAELYDPATGTWSYTGNMSTARRFPNAFALPNGKALVLGGGKTVTSVDLFDPAGNGGAGTFTPMAPTALPHFQSTATLLPNGTILIAGGENFVDGYTTAVEIYDPAANGGQGAATIVPGGLPAARYRYTVASVLRSGRVLIAGGASPVYTTSGWYSVSSTVLYDPVANTFVAGPSMTIERSWHTMTLLPSGKVFIVGGGIDPTTFRHRTTELFE